MLLVPASIQAIGSLILFDAVSLATPLMILNARAKRSGQRARLEVLLDRINPNILSISLLSTTGVLLILGFDWGLYFLFAAAIIGMVGGLLAAWFVLLHPAKDMEEDG